MSTPTAQTIDGPTALMLGALACLWGCTYFFVGFAVREVTPLTLVLSRLAIAALVLHAVRIASGVAMPAALWPRLAVMALLNNAIPFSLIFWAQTIIPAGLASILNAATPVFGVIVAALVRQERLTANRALGVVAGFAGVAVLVGPSALAGAGSLWPELACLAATLSYAFSTAYARVALSGVAPLVLAAGQLTASSVLVAPLALAVEAPWALPLPSAPVLAAALALGVFSTALAYILFFRILARAGSTNLLLVTFLIPIVAVLLGVALLDEALLSRHLGGFALIAAGLAAIDGRLLRRVRRGA
ncbi:MAG: DMT family transporter [Acetobacteraceae bacterium]|jgi:drug/metabolite transporter (DMT)-like permease|nr:DMT family transporter [Acetobacteraceae bacterium]